MDRDRQLVRLAKQGNKAAFGKLVRKYRDDILKLAYDFLKDYEEARDIAQDIFIKAYQNIDTFEERAKFSSWLYRIAVNTCLDVLKRVSQKREMPLRETDKNRMQSGTKHALETSGFDDRMYAAINQLSENQRTALILRYFHDKNITEIAEVLSCAENTVRIHLHRAMKKMSQILKK